MEDLERRLYLALHRGSPGDVPFYFAVSSGVRSVLELGVGDGRILSQLDVPVRVGLDLDPGMVRLAQQRCPGARIEVGDMERFELGMRFDRVLIPASALFALPGFRAQQRCFEAVARHLQPGGELWLDAYGSDTFHAEAEPETDDLGRAELEVLDDIDFEGTTVRVYEANLWVREEQRFEIVYWFELKERVIEQPLVHHYLLSDQLRELAEAAGLELVHLWSTFDRRPFTAESEKMIAGFRRP